jgi:hypothetical protein
MEPGCEGRVTPKAANRPKQMNEHFLSEVFSVRSVLCHPQANCVNTAMVLLIDFVKRLTLDFVKWLSFFGLSHCRNSNK